ncbi:T9SS type A sorting domain-containing protein [Polaribacter sp. IC066]|uniref:T9SS type A sorting domain-containing protein n=1 Tax=Polaribacter sp. IC066 TaxID=57032 RepID=UPI0011BE6407|nr:T9SS type A sorting domain-containing protein [Polaribacter sp. IC066]TXD62491.1 T9SS type A sorting domain-containing protein [Polaribacter sp. IC066]
MKKNYIFTLLMTLCFSAVSFCQGSETFTDATLPSSYSDDSFVGAGGVTWTYLGSRDANGDSNNSGISLPAIMLRRVSDNSKITSSTIVGGIGDFSVKLYKGFTGGGDRQVELFINGVSKGTSTPFDDFNEQTFTVSGINISGDVIIEIVNTTSKQVIIDDITWTAPSAAPSVTVTNGSEISELDYFFGNGPSAEKDFSVGGTNLTEDILVTAPASFEVSLASGGTFTESFTLTQTNGVITSTDVYVRLKASLAVNTYAGNIVITSAGADDETVALSGEISPAEAQFSYTAFLNDFNYVESDALPSEEQTFTVEGLFLTGDLMVTAAANYEVSLTTANGFADAVTITPSSGSVAETTVYARLKAGLTLGSYTGDITISSAGVADGMITVNGTVFGGTTNSIVITGVYDGSLTGGNPKGIEVYVLKDVADLSSFGVSSVSNGGGSTAGTVEFAFPAGSATAGTFIYVSTEEEGFNTFFGMNPTYTSGSMGINGDDAIELYENGQIIDVFGDVNNDFSGQVYDYLDGWAYRKSNTSPDGTTFTTENWTYSGVDGLEGGTNNATATVPFPIGSYANTTASVRNTSIEGFTTYPNPVTNNIFTIKSNSSETKEVSIFNVLGKRVLSSRFSGIQSNVDVSSISAGLYILKVTEGTKTATSKLVIR